MNGDDKEEAHRPRPLSAGIWTLFSWLRRSERSSSSESVSSVGSARTAVSFDFLAPGNYNFTDTPIVLTTPLNPPTETYKKRLQERNLRRLRDRDVTLHRKYGLYREHVNGYEGLSLPPARRTLGNTDRPNRERRATSECLQRRAAYVPGKRRAPLPPALITSASLPRTYKRKRPAPKPPIKPTDIENNNIVQLRNNPVRMTSNAESVSDNELLKSSKTQKCDKKVTTSKDIKSKTDKSFLKQIFENRKRSSVIETTSVRLLPSISELDKQATEIIASNKLRQKINKVNRDDLNTLEDTDALYEGNSWFCTSCLRKYNSSIDSCNYCMPDKRHSLKNDVLKPSSPRSSIYTQTNINAKTAGSSRSGAADDRKVLKEILKEMKDSLPKKNKDNKVNNILTEIPTLKIGSTVQETYKDFTPQPSSSGQFLNNNSRILTISSLLSDTQSTEQKKNSDQHVLPGAKDLFPKSVSQSKVTSSFGNKINDGSSSAMMSVNNQEHTSAMKNVRREKNENSYPSSILLSNNTKNNTSQTQSPSPLRLTKTNDSKEIKLQVSHDSPILLDNKDKSNVRNSQIEVIPTSAVTNVSTEFEKALPNLSKLQFLNFPNSHAVVVNRVTVVTTHSNDKSSETSKNISLKNTENNIIPTDKAKTKNDNGITDLQFQSPAHMNSSVNHITNKGSYLENKANLVKSLETSIDKVQKQINLLTPLNISSLLNPPSNKILGKPNNTAETSNSNALKAIHSNKDDPMLNKELATATQKVNVTTSTDIKTTYLSKDLTEPQIKETLKTEPHPKKDVSYEQEALPSTSGRSNSVTNPKNMDKLDHYNERRHLINQLEQSIAKGDEVAAAEAAVKLAKLRLSCSVLSFSSQIVGATSGTKQNEDHNIVDINASSKDKPLEQSKPVLIAETVEHADTQAKKSELVHNILQNMDLSSNDSTELGNNSDQKPQSSSGQASYDEIVPINIWIEDKQTTRGPIGLNISKRATVRDLRQQAEHSLGLATQLQRWIVGHTLCTDDESPIISLAGPHLRAPFYLCIVQPDQNDKPKTEVINESQAVSASDQNGEFYTELMKLEKQSLIPNIEPFECAVCMEECAAGAGVILRECIHTFCRECLSDVVQHSQEPAVACPAMGCTGFLQEREIRTIVTPDEYEKWLARSLATAECRTRNAFHCRTRDCTGWAFCDPGVRRFPCPVCNTTNCVQCQAIHEGETCEEYQTKLRQRVTAVETYKDDEGTQVLLNSLIARGEALECPECKAIITKKWGCDWVKCSACKTEICWITKGRRWGPGGRGDTSGGCRCGVDGQRCHPSCGYCH